MISGETTNKKELVAKFKSGEIQVLCNADILITGFDEPKASACLNLRPTRSRVVAEQRGGRVLRLNEDDAEKHAYVIDFIDKNLSEHLFPILFAHVAGDAEVEGKVFEGGGGGKPGPRLPYIAVGGLEVVTDTEEIMKIVNKMKPVEKEKVELIKDLATLKQAIKDSGIKPGENLDKSYQEARKTHPHWHSTPYRLPGWTSYADLWGKEE